MQITPFCNFLPASCRVPAKSHDSYTGGRDGAICAWDLDLATHKASVVEDGSGDATLKDANSTTFRTQVQAHTHWVNDIVLVQDSALVSASSDVTVKVWRPHGSDASSAQTIGVHSDYVKCVATPYSNASWVASGGLDHKICLWDLNGAGKSLEIDILKADNVVKGSVYALCAKGSVLASGGPEGVVRLWDPKSGKSITKLVGHTDNIRGILMSNAGDVLLTGSSDQTVKVWSLVAGRCMHTLTMHNESVWCMYSDHPSLSVFYSGDRSGLVAKTDVRYADEFDEGVSVAVCQDHEGIARIVTAGDFLWTASSSSSVNRWRDVDTEAEIETPPQSPLQERSSSSLSKTTQAGLPMDGAAPETNEPSNDKKIPFTGVLRLSITAPHPGRKSSQQSPVQSPPSIRKASEVILDPDPGFVTPIRSQPTEILEGQNGLIKHALLNDRTRVLTLDTAGEVVLWDLLKVCISHVFFVRINACQCIPIRSYGKRHLEDVIPEVNTTESIANWCAVDTRTGKLSVMLEENYCFDAEVYADGIDIPEKIDFREDQRSMYLPGNLPKFLTSRPVNLGKWVLRNLFTTLVDEEIKRDEVYRRSFRTEAQSKPTNGIQRKNIPPAIMLPPLDIQSPLLSPNSLLTPRATNILVPMTPGMPIKAATPGLQTTHTPGQAPATLPSTAEEGSDSEEKALEASQTPVTTDRSSDYFSNSAGVPSGAPSESGRIPATPSEALGPGINPVSPNDDKEEKKKSTIFGKKFQMAFPKKLGRNSVDAKQIMASSEESKSEDMSDKSSEREEKVLEDNFYGVVQRIRQEYAEQLEAHPDQLGALSMGITPSLPNETPVLKPPPHTQIIIREDNPESGGLADLYRGEISQLGRDADALERIAPMWLGELLLKVSTLHSVMLLQAQSLTGQRRQNHIPYKDTVKVSFILLPYQDLLPSIASSDGYVQSFPPSTLTPYLFQTDTTSNVRLNANRMLRSKKILTYVAERIEIPPLDTQPQEARDPTQYPAAATTTDPAVDDSKLRPEEYLELYCQDRLVHSNTTLATLRAHIWKTAGDIVLYYKSNGRKKLRLIGNGIAGSGSGAGTEAVEAGLAATATTE
jgi:WD repeat-containing protein 48